jgi:inner membrane protein
MSQPLIWAIVGVVLIITEILSTTFVLVFFGIGALLVALLLFVGIVIGIKFQLVVFATSSLCLLAVMRKFLKKRFAGSHDMVPDYINKIVPVSKDILPGEEGNITYRGSEWIAFSDHSEIIKIGEKVRVIGIDGIRLKVERVTKTADEKEE